VEPQLAKLTSGIGDGFAFAHSGKVQELEKNATGGTHALNELAQNAWEKTTGGIDIHSTSASNIQILGM